jgi:hypothetical protein
VITEHHDIRQHHIDEGREKNKATRHVPNRTKVVRLIVVPPGVNPENADEVSRFAAEHHATRADVFCVKTKAGKWQPMSWLGGELVDHETAHDAHPEVVLVLMVIDREQVQWECDYDFCVTQIVAAENDHFPNRGASPGMPFRQTLINEKGGRGRPVVSGPPEWSDAHNDYDRLYKASFRINIPWEGLVDIDPDMYCDWQ